MRIVLLGLFFVLFVFSAAAHGKASVASPQAEQAGKC